MQATLPVNLQQVGNATVTNVSKMIHRCLGRGPTVHVFSR